MNFNKKKRAGYLLGVSTAMSPKTLRKIRQLLVELGSDRSLQFNYVRLPCENR